MLARTEESMTEGREERVKFSVDITPALRRRIRLAAAERDMTLRELLIELVEAGLGETVEVGSDIGRERG